MFDEHVSRIGGGGFTVTLKVQMVDPPQLSVAVQLTGVVPIGKVLPLGGLQCTTGGLQPPVAVAEP
jgi:hypothetical protein